MVQHVDNSRSGFMPRLVLDNEGRHRTERECSLRKVAVIKTAGESEGHDIRFEHDRVLQLLLQVFEASVWKELDSRMGESNRKPVALYQRVHAPPAVIGRLQ